MEDEGIEQDIAAVESSLGIIRISAPQQERPLVSVSNAVSAKESSTKSWGVESYSRVMAEQAEEERILLGDNAVDLDLSAIRGIKQPEEQKAVFLLGLDDIKSPEKIVEEMDLEALAELVPGLKTGQVGALAVSPSEHEGGSEGRGSHSHSQGRGSQGRPQTQSPDHKAIPNLDSMVVNPGGDEEYEVEAPTPMNALLEADEDSENSEDSEGETSDEKTTTELITSYDNGKPAELKHAADGSSSSASSAGKTHCSDNVQGKKNVHVVRPVTAEQPYGQNQHQNNRANPTPYQDILRNDEDENHRVPPATPPRDGVNDDSYYGTTPSPNRGEFHAESSAASLSTATQSHEVRMPMYLPNFRPATGCTNASDFIVRCFVARLRAGITVVKHGRSRWCKSRLRVLHVHSDGRSLSWRPAQGEPSSNKRPPKLDLSTCLEVRHAWSPDPLNPMFTGTPILRSKCEASNAFKSFALIFPRRTVDITAVTADQCKVLMEGFSALCFRLQVANMAGRGRGIVVNAEGEGGEKAEGENGGKDGPMTATTAMSTTKAP